MNDNEIWHKRREQLEEAVKKAVLDLFEHTHGAASFSFVLPGTKGLRIEVRTVRSDAGDP